ncbi:MAG: 5-formyltetrahydrofolate cyclo-ligase, partial [Bacillota bacterium]
MSGKEEADKTAAAKKALRRAVLAARQALDEVTVQQKSEAICRRLMALPVWEKARTLMAYVDFRGEVATDLLIFQALATGKTVAAPVTIISEKKLIPVVIERYPEDLQPGAWGIREPDPARGRHLAPQELDLVIVPGVAYDVKGNRLGYGGGFYDR